MPRRSEWLGFAVPISKPRYSCVESQATTSPPSCSASFTPSADFPDAVGPTMATRGKSTLFSLIERGEDCPEPVGAGVSLVSGFDGQIIQEIKPQLDVRSAECRWQRFERIRRANGRHG